MARKRIREEEEAMIDMTPMLDIVFIMLIFFIVTTSFVKEAGIEVNKPKAAQQTTQKNANIFVAIKDTGDIWLDKRRVDIELVGSTIEKLLAEQPTDVVIIQADKAAKHGDVVAVMDAIKEAGSNLRISIAAAKGEFMVRFLVSILLGAAVTFGLFIFMAFLVSSGDRNDEEKLENIIVEVNTTPPKSSVEHRQRVPPPPPPPPKAPPKQMAPEPEASNDNGGIQFNMPGVQLSGASAGLSAPGAGFGRDGDATPIVRIEPKYPIQAARDGKEGWVILSFTINEIGGVEDVKVIDAKPKRVFDKEAKRALRKWKYKPKVVDGKPLKQPGLQVQLDFKMDGGE